MLIKLKNLINRHWTIAYFVAPLIICGVILAVFNGIKPYIYRAIGL